MHQALGGSGATRRQVRWRIAVALCAVVWGTLCGGSVLAADGPNYVRTPDLIYARKFGLALTMDVFRPKAEANGLAVVYVVSGGWFSSHDIEGLIPGFAPLLDRGYTVFAVVHGSQPKFAIPEILQDLHRAVRYIRFHGKEYGIDPERIGIVGASAGGHLALMLGTAGGEGDPKAKDPVDRVSSKVQAVGCFFPPTDFLNYGKAGEIAVGRGRLANFAGAFDFQELDPKIVKYKPIADEAKILEIGRKISPITHVSAESAPALVIHGDKDWIVPLQQAESFVEKMKAAGAKAKLVVKPGADHGWPEMGKDLLQIADWFDLHLKAKAEADGPAATAPPPQADSAQSAPPPQSAPRVPVPGGRAERQASE